DRDVTRSDPVASESAGLTGEAAENSAGDAATGQPTQEHISETSSYMPMTEQTPSPFDAGEHAHETAGDRGGDAEFDSAPAQQADNEDEVHTTNETSFDDASQPSTDTNSFEQTSSEAHSSNGQDQTQDSTRTRNKIRPKKRRSNPSVAP